MYAPASLLVSAWSPLVDVWTANLIRPLRFLTDVLANLLDGFPFLLDVITALLILSYGPAPPQKIFYYVLFKNFRFWQACNCRMSDLGGVRGRVLVRSLLVTSY